MVVLSRTMKRWMFTIVCFMLIAVPLVAAQPSIVSTSASQSRPMSLGNQLISTIALNPQTPNILAFGQQVNLTFNYTTDEPGGVRIYIHPYSSGAPTPNYVVSGSPLYPTGSGSGSDFFTISSGPMTVDQILFQMYNADQRTLLYEAFIPVSYQFQGTSTLVTNIQLDPPTPNILPFGQDVSLTFNYTTGDPGGVLIYVLPFSDGAFPPNSRVSGSPVYPTGSGSGSSSFTILSGSVIVDQIRFQVYNADQSTLLYEALIPVSYQFQGGATLVSGVHLDPPTPNILPFGQDVNLTFNYTTDDPGGVRIFARPFSAGVLTPNQGASGSPLYPTGSGSGNGSFTILSGPVIVDQIRFQVYNADQSTLLYEAFIPVHYQYGDSFSQVYLPLIIK
ncbi:MAG: hypothetical protein H0X37_17525 [Herpetosiphonaceae bacterium]|nr:hypothetical protein [Herpetosiphonaceae bacterium]